MRQQVTLAQALEGTLVLVNETHPLQAWPERDALIPALPGAAQKRPASSLPDAAWKQSAPTLPDAMQKIPASALSNVTQKHSIPALPDAPQVLLRRPAAAMLRALLDSISAAGRIVPVSGWRAHAEQEALYAGSVRENGLAFTQTYVALPGCSEHESGLAIDVGEARDEIDFIRPAFPDTGICAAFRAAAPRYGFILRYPEGARHITHIGSEPWHFRYVGVPHAAYIAQRGCTLEEYIGELGAYSHANPLRLREDGREYRIFRVPLSPDGAEFDVPAGCLWQTSADNCGGLIVTLWGAP